MSQHTPGPWAFGRDPHSSLYRVSSPDSPPAVATVRPAAGRCEDADARLIAAAPDLLAACLASISCFDGTDPRPNGIFVSPEKLIRAAVAKATGEGGES